jgi:protein-serine/threonine kinase
LHETWETERICFLVTEVCEGGELFYHLRRENYFKESRAKFYAVEMLLALECLHKNGVIYRDLKPENVILDAQGHLKLTDFGLSKL